MSLTISAAFIQSVAYWLNIKPLNAHRYTIIGLHLEVYYIYLLLFLQALCQKLLLHVLFQMIIQQAYILLFLQVLCWIWFTCYWTWVWKCSRIGAGAVRSAQTTTPLPPVGSTWQPRLVSQVDRSVSEGMLNSEGCLSKETLKREKVGGTEIQREGEKETERERGRESESEWVSER